MKKTTTRRRLSCSYLYTDGTLIQLFDEYRDEVLIGQTADITLGYCTLNMYRREERWSKADITNGRIVFGRYEAQGVLDIARGGKIEATMPSLGGGSEHSKRLGLAVQYVSVTSAKGLKLDWCEIPSVIGGTFCLQDDMALSDHYAHGAWEPGHAWGGARVWKVKDLRPKTPEYMLDKAESA